MPNESELIKIDFDDVIPHEIINIYSNGKPHDDIKISMSADGASTLMDALYFLFQSKHNREKTIETFDSEGEQYSLTVEIVPNDELENLTKPYNS